MDASSDAWDIAALLEHRDFVRGLARQLLVDEQRAEDVAQDVLVDCLGKARGKGDAARGGMRAYLAAAVRHLALRERRSAARRDAREHRAARAEVTAATDTIVAREEWRARLVAAVLELEPRQREVVLLRYFDGLAPRRIARVLDVPVDTVKTRLKRGLANLREKLRREDSFDGLALLAMPLGAATGGNAALSVGALTMTHTSKLVLVAAAVLCAGMIYRVTRPAAQVPVEESVVSAASNDDVRIHSQAASTSPTPETTPREAVAVGAEPHALVPALLGRAVLRDDEQPLAGATVELRIEGREDVLALTTDIEGRFDLVLESPARLRTARITAGARHGAMSESLDLALEPGAARELVLRAPRGMRITGRVVDLEDQPIVSAEVLGWCAAQPDAIHHRVAITDAHGSFELEHLGETFYVEPRATGWAATNAITGSSGKLVSSDDLVLRMARTTAWMIRVVDADAVPVADAEVQVAVVSPWASTAVTRSENVFLRAPASAVLRAVANVAGTVQFEHLPAVQHQVTVRSPGFLVAKLRGIPGGERLEVILARGKSLFGTVFEDDGQPAAGALVRLIDRDDVMATQTDDEGRFEFPSARVSLGSWLSVRAEGYAALVHEPVRINDSPLRLQLELAASIAGVLLDFDGTPLGDARLAIRGERSVRGEATRPFEFQPTWEGLVLDLYETRTDEAGRFSFESLNHGAYELSTVQEHEGVERRQAWTVHAGETDRVLRLDPTAFEDMVFEGRAFDALTGLAVSEFTITVVGRFHGLEGNACAFSSRPITVRNEDGRYRIGGFSPMESKLIVKAPGYCDPRFELVERGAGVQPLDLELFPTRSLEVRVLDADGVPIKVTLVVADGEGRSIWLPSAHRAMTGSVRTDERGEAMLQGLPATTIQIFVYLHRADGDTRDERFTFELEQPLHGVQVLQTEFRFED